MEMITIPFFYPKGLLRHRLSYVIDFLNWHPLCPQNIEIKIMTKEAWQESNAPRWSIHYGEKPFFSKNAYYIPAQALFFFKKIQDTASFFANAYLFETFQLFAVEKTTQKPRPFLIEKNFGFDLIESIFFHISRYEEQYCPTSQWDKYDMMQEDKQFLVRHHIHQKPVVDVLVYCFFQALGFLPKKSTTIYQMSHDIDSVWKLPSFYKLLRANARLLLDGNNLTDVWRLTQRYIDIKRGKANDPHDVFDWFLSSNSKVKKVLYLMAGGKTNYEGFYPIDHPYVKRIIEKAKNLGYDIGLHPSYLTWKNGDMFQRELKRLEDRVGEKIQKSRQHFLHFSFEQSPNILEQASIKNDSSLGYQNLIGFRCGTGFDFYPYHFGEERACHFTERPLVVMDCALLTANKHDIEKVQQSLYHFLRQNHFLSQITFNFHNHIFDDTKSYGMGMKKIFEQVQQWIK